MFPISVPRQDSYSSPPLRLEIEYATFPKDHTLFLYSLTIESNVQYDDCHKWVLYFTDIPTIERLYLLLRTTPKVMKDFFTAKFDRIADLEEITTKLESLIKKYRDVAIFPHPLGYEPQVTGVWYTKGEFVPPPSRTVSISYFVNKIADDLERLKGLKLIDSDCKCKQFRELLFVANETNNFIRFLNRNCEDFLIFLRFFRDLDKYVKVRESKTSLYRLEKEQFSMLKNALRTELKRPFELMNRDHIYTIMYKVFLPLLKHSPYSPGLYFFYCLVCE